MLLHPYRGTKGGAATLPSSCNTPMLPLGLPLPTGGLGY